MDRAEAVVQKLGFTEHELAETISDRFHNEFPNLKCLSAKNFKNITSDLVIEIFLAYYRHFGVGITSILPTNPDHMENITDPSQDQLLPYLDMTNLLKYILGICVDISINNLLCPEPMHSITGIGLLENYCEFFDFKQESINGEICNITEKIQQHQQLQKKREELRQEANNRASIRAHHESKVQQLRERIKEETMKIKPLADSHKQASDIHDSMTAKVHTVRSQLENNKANNMAKSQDIAQLEKQIAPSSTLLKADLGKCTKKLEEINVGIDEHTHSLDKQKEACVLREQLIDWAKKQLEKLLQSNNKNEQLAVEKRTVSGGRTLLGDELETLQEEISMDSVALKTLQEDMTGLRLQKEKILVALKNSLADVDTEHLQMDVKSHEVKHKLKQLQLSCGKVNEEGNSHLQKGTESAKIVTDLQDEIIEKYKRKQAAFGQSLEGTLADLVRELEEVKKRK